MSVLLFLSVTAYADTATDTIDQACARQAISVANQLKHSIFNNMDSAQEKSIIEISANECRKQFHQGDTAKVAASKQESVKQAEEDDDDDWFTRYILESEGSRKDGNKRLRKMQTK